MKLQLASFRINLMVLSMLIILPAVGLMIYDGVEQMNLARKNMSDNALLIAHMASLEQQQVILATELLLDAFSELPAVRQKESEECGQTAAQIITDLPRYANLAVVNVVGDLVCSAVPAASQTNLADRTWFQRAVSTKQFVVGDYVIGRLTGRPVLVLAKPILDDEGVIEQVVYASLDLSWLYRFVLNTGVTPGQTIFAADQTGTVLFFSPDTLEAAGNKLTSPEIYDAVLAQEHRTANVRDADGVNRIYGITTLHARNQTGNVIFGVGIPADEALSEARSALIRNLSGLALVTLLAGLATWFGGDLFFLSRIRAMVAVTRRLAAGDLSARTGIEYGRSEISQMAEAFDGMAAAMQDQQEKTAAAVAALGQSETRYRRLAENAPDIIFRYRTSPEPGFDFVSPACTRITGYTPEEFYDNPLLGSQLVYPDGQDFWQVEGGQPGKIIQPWVRKDGQQIWTDQHSAAVRDGAGNLVAIEGVVRDITDKKRAEELMSRRLAELRVLYTVTGIAIQAVDEDDLIERVTNAIGGSLFPDNFGLCLLDAQTGLIVPHPAYRKQVHDSILALKPGEGIIGMVFQTGLPILAPDVNAEPAYRVGIPETRAELAVPLEFNGRVIGVLNTESSQVGAFGETDLHLMQMLAHELTSAMERLRLNRQTEKRMQQLVSLRRIDLAITTSFDMDIPLQVLLEEAFTNLPIQAAGVLLYHPETNTLRKAAHFHLDRRVDDPVEGSLRDWVPAGVSSHQGLGIERVFIADLSVEDHPRARRLFAAGFSSAYSLPLVAKGQFIGLLQVFSRQPLTDDHEQAGYLEMLAGQAAIALDNAHMFRDLQTSNQELQQAYDDTIAGWSHAMDLRDGETEGHSRRVADMAVRLAERMGYPAEKLAHLWRGALLHDMGKMAIPDGILSKPGKLEPDEWEIMRMHPQYALDMLGNIEFLKPAVTIPYCHHEKWDGTGYPRGLKGESIPLEARIFSVVDVWDALTSDRPYRKRWPKEGTADYIREQSGKHFEPRVVEAFLAFLQQEQLVLPETVYSGD